MRRINLLFFSLIFCLTIVGQNKPAPAKPIPNKVITQKVQVVEIKDSTVCNFINETAESVRKPKYELYSTQNMWNFLKLNTITGQIYVVQYSLEGSQLQVPLNRSDLLWADEPHVCGRFKLFPTQNMWNFILLDQINGNVWQVQWSTNPSQMGIFRIPGKDF